LGIGIIFCSSLGSEDRHYIVEAPGQFCYSNEDSTSHHQFSVNLWPYSMLVGDMIFRNLLRCSKKFDWQTGFAGQYFRGCWAGQNSVIKAQILLF